MRSTSSSPTPSRMAPELLAMAPAPPLPAPVAERVTANILVAEPDPLVREILAAGLALHQPSWHIEVVATAEEVMARAVLAAIDLLVVELALPEARRGVELLAHVR